MELMNVATEVANNSAALSAAENSLTAMNGGAEVAFEADFYPLEE